MKELEDNSKYLYYFLIFSILVGIFVRFWGIGESYLEGDESIWMVSSIKLHFPSAYDPRLYGYEHPPTARWFIGLPAKFINADFGPTMAIPMEMFVYNYFVPFKEVYVPTRMVSAIFGLFSVVLVFLISRNLFGLKAAIWSTVLASLSFDLIFFSRWTLSESVFIGLALFTIYFYIKYLQEKAPEKRLVLMIAAIIFFTLALGTRAFTPMFLIPVLIISQLLLNRKFIKENMIFFVLLAVGIYMNFYVIWPPEVRDLGQKLHGVYSASDILKFSALDVVLVNVYRNSYLYLFSILLLLYNCIIFFKRNPDGATTYNKLSNYIKNPNSSLVIWLLLIVSIGGFTFTKYTQTKYMVILFVPIYILLGSVLEKASKNRILSFILIFLVAINFLFFARAYPYYSEYQNFYFGKCGDYMISCSSTGWQNHIPELKQAISYLEGVGTPPVMTNEFNILAFYKGDTIPLIATDPRCNLNDVAGLAKKYKYIVYWGSRGAQTDLRIDPYFCQYLRQLPMDLVKTFGNYTLSNTDPETLKVKIYEIKT